MIKTKIIEVKPMEFKPMKGMELKPIEVKPLFMDAGGLSQSKVLPDSSGLPKPTEAQLKRFEKNSQRIIDTVVVSSLKKHRSDVLHGGRSLNLLLQSKRPSGDWDIFSPTEKSRATQIERAIDRKAGADVSYVKYCPIPKVTAGPDAPNTSKDLYRVITLPSGDSDVDVMDKPRGLPTIRKNGITHESLESQYEKTKQGLLQPMRMSKASVDKKRIEEHFRSQGKQPPKKDMNYPQAQRFFGLAPFGDADKDGVPNQFDCKPFDASRQGILHDLFDHYSKGYTPGSEDPSEPVATPIYDKAVSAGRRIKSTAEHAAQVASKHIRARMPQYQRNVQAGMRDNTMRPPISYHMKQDTIDTRGELLHRLQEQRIQQLMMENNLSGPEAQDIAVAETESEYDQYAHGVFNRNVILWRKYRPLRKAQCFVPYRPVR